MPPKSNPARAPAAQAGRPAVANPASTASTSEPLDLTIQGELKRIANVKDQYPAVDLVAALLRHITVNVNLAPRDVHTTGQILLRSNKVYEAIIDAMKTLDGEAEDALDLNWSLFDNYTTAIPLLERILLNLPHITQPKDITRTQLPPNTSTQDAVTHITFWVKERIQLKLALDELKHESIQKLSPSVAEAIVAEYLTHRSRDDTSIMRAVNDFITNDKLAEKDIIKDKESGPTVLADVKELIAGLIASISEKPPSEEVNGIVVRALLTTYVPFAVIANTNTSYDWKIYLKKGNIWASIKDFLNKVKDVVATPGDNLEKEFALIEGLLLNLGEIAINTAKEMLQLIKLAAWIPRPYSGRTAALVKAIYNVDQYSRKNEQKPLSGHRYGLKQTMETSYTELTAVRNSPYDFQTFSLESDEYKKRKESIKKLFSTIEPLFTSFGITSEWTGHDKTFSDSVDTDEKHMTEGKKAIFP